MPTTFTQKAARVFGLGRMPAERRAQMESEGQMLYLAEGIAETAILRGFKAPGARCAYRRMLLVGFFALSERRLVARAKCFHKIDIDTTFDDPKFRRLEFRATPHYLSLMFDPSSYLPDASGRVEIRLHLPDVRKAAELLEAKGACLAAEPAAK